MHEFVASHLRLLPRLVRSGVFDQEAFTLIDVGCSRGIHSIWRRWGNGLRAYCFDPVIEEINRLSNEENNPNVQYYAAFIGLPDAHPFKVQQAQERPRYIPDNALSRSCHKALRKHRQKTPSPFERGHYRWKGQELTEDVVSLSDFVEDHKIAYVDFVKIDTDGADLEVAVSCEKMIEACTVLGFAIEANYVGSFYATENTFANVDRFMRQHGFKLFNLSQARCARAALPMPFRNRWPGQTRSGQVIWGDFLYLRDPVDTEFSQHGVFTPTPRQLLKLISLYELFGLSDCAAELAIERRDDISDLVDVDWLLDTLTPPLDGLALSYEEYLRTFYTETEAFYPRANLKN